jgi:flagellar hook protein FlgE
LFVVAKPTSEVDNQPVFSGVNNYTRAGDFQLNSGGYLLNGAGCYWDAEALQYARQDCLVNRVMLSVSPVR